VNPSLEWFLEDIFRDIEPTSSAIGRVVLEPEYEATPNASDAPMLRDELIACMRQQAPGAADLASHDGAEVRMLSEFSTLSRYVRRVTLHQDRLPGSWVEITPPGNWI